MFHFSTKLLVGSVFVPHERTSFWYKLQIEFLKKTVKNFRHVVCVNGHMDHGLFSESKVITASNEHCCNAIDGLDQSKNHFKGLSALVNYFRNSRSEDYLILDSDCFPVMESWHDCLKSKMGDLKFAAPYRVENLDCFPHPCAFFIRGKHVHDEELNFVPSEVRSLIGKDVKDVGCGIPTDNCYPLIRSNFVNLHPVFSAIYNHMFYHHGCGSRSLLTRSILHGYFDHYLDEDFHLYKMENLINQLEDNSQGFIDLLMRGPN